MESRMDFQPNNSIYKYIARTLRNLRIHSNLTQEHVAEKIDVSPQTFSRYETSGKIKNHILERIVLLYNIKDLEHFFRKCYQLKSFDQDDIIK